MFDLNEKRKKYPLKMDNYDYLEDIVDEAEAFCTVHEIKLERDESRWFMIWPYGVMLLAGISIPEERVAQIAALFAYLWYKGIPCSMAEQLAASYVVDLMEYDKKKQH